MGGFLNLVKGEEEKTLAPDDREQLEVMAGVSAFPHAGEVRDAALACDEIGAGTRNHGENGMSEDQMNEETGDLKPDAPAETAGEAAALSPELQEFGDKLIAALKTVYDPEIPVDIYELGLIYKVDVADNKDVTVDMTLTAPGCPVAGEMPKWCAMRC